MGLFSLSYWMTAYSHQNEVIWHGMVYGWEENGNFKIDTRDTDPSLIQLHQTGRIGKLEWIRAWEDVTFNYQIKSGSENANLSTIH